MRTNYPLTLQKSPETFDQHVTGVLQTFDPNANPVQGFGSFNGEFTSTLIMP